MHYAPQKEGDFLYKIMIVEDDKALSNGIALALQATDVEIIQCHDIKSSKTRLASLGLDLIILDINLPDGSGLNLLLEVKKDHTIPIIMLTANDMETDIVTGLEMGADDYITKPFSLAILRARVNTQLRRHINSNTNIFRQDGFVFDFDKMQFHRGSQSINLSKTEQRLLRILVENKGITLERGTLLDRIWTDGSEYVDENALSVTIKRLRDKLEDKASQPRYIKTIYGIGYVWAVDK